MLTEHDGHCEIYCCEYCSCGYQAQIVASEKALSDLRSKLTGDSDKDAPILLTMYFKNGSDRTIGNVDESSIRFDEGKFTFEDDDKTSNCRIYTFYDVIGHSSTFV